VGYHVDNLSAVARIDLSNSYNPIVALPFSAVSAQPPDNLRVTIDALHAQRAKVLIQDVVSDKVAAALRAVGVDMISMRPAVK
jgi:hypothetical protein